MLENRVDVTQCVSNFIPIEEKRFHVCIYIFFMLDWSNNGNIQQYNVEMYITNHKISIIVTENSWFLAVRK